MDNKIVYQIYPKSFKDNNHDGEGDLQGIISKLDYLKDLGVDILWLTPVFVSPQNDNGYDVQDYYHVDPRFGSDEDLDLLISNAKERGMDIMLDMVFNHSSTYHPWFQKALTGDQSYMDRYFFVKEPVNWESKFGGNAFEYVEDLDMYYLHLFDKTQADLNWENEAVFNELVNICNHWLDKGVRGFRFDVINLISKPEVFKDDDKGDGRRFYTDGDKVTQNLRRLGEQSFAQYSDVMTVGELSSTSIEKASQYSKRNESGLSTIFNFHHLKVDYKDGQKWALKPFDFIALKTLYRTWQNGMVQNDASMSLFLSNHDQPRAISRFTDESFEGGSMLMNMIMSLKGVVYLYQGEEIGLPNANFDAIDLYRDIESLNYYKVLLKDHSEAEVLEILRERSRDNGRTPMPWDDSQYYGFSKQEPWIPFSKSNKLRSVQSMIDDKTSLLHYTKDLIKIRKTDPVLIHGDVTFMDMDHPQLFVYTRSYNHKTYLCIHNFYKESVTYPFTYKNVIAHNYHDVIENQLRPYESMILEIEA